MVGIVIAARIPVRLNRGDELSGQCRLGIGDAERRQIAAWHIERRCGAQLVTVAQNLQHDLIALRHERAQTLTRADHDLSDGHASCSAKRLAKERVGFGARLLRREVVRRLEVAHRDLVGTHRAEHVDRARRSHVGGGEVVVGERDPSAVLELVAFDDGSPRHLFAGALVDAPVVNCREIARVEQMKREVVRRGCREETDGNRDESE